MQEAYIVAGYRTAVTKSKKGGFRFTRPDDLAVEVIKGLLASVPSVDPLQVEDVIVGNAVPEAEQGLQVGRIIASRAVGIHAAGVTVNRYCASGLETIAIASAKIRNGMADCIIAGGTESMTMVFKSFLFYYLIFYCALIKLSNAFTLGDAVSNNTEGKIPIRTTNAATDTKTVFSEMVSGLKSLSLK